MKRFSLLFQFFCAFIYPQTFHSLDGIENQQGQTILLYRLGSDYYIYNPVYKFNTSTLQENLIMTAFNHEPVSYARGIWDFEFFPGDENNFMNAGHYIMPDDYGFIARNDSDVFIEAPGEQLFVDISKQDPLKVFVFPSMIRSWDGGYTFPIDSIPATINFNPVSMADFDDKTFFGINADRRFCKNGLVVDTTRVFIDRYFKMLYDKDQLHIYRTNEYPTYPSFYVFHVSDNQGSAFTWTESFFSLDPIVMTNDSLSPGVVYVTDKNSIWKSIDYGYNFTYYKSLPYRIYGMYKKPGSEILYAATRYRIYKITPDTSVVIRSLPVPKDLADYYPLKTGNKWIFDRYFSDWLPPYYIHDITTREILGDSVAVNDKKYKLVIDKSGFFPETYTLERIDSAEGRIYRYSEDYLVPPEKEYLIEDLSAEIGDSINSYRYGFFDPSGKTILIAEDSITIWDSTFSRKSFEQGNLLYFNYALTKHIGLDSADFEYDFGDTHLRLKGCVLDGIVYGDTTTTSVDDYRGMIPENIVLYQNYPNPFNPSTSIKYSLSSRQFVNIKVYDVTGREVALLLKEEKPAGTYEIKFDGSALPSGVYFCKMQAGNHHHIMKMILLK